MLKSVGCRVKNVIFGKYILPFLQWYALMILLAIAIDYLLHLANAVFIGRYLGMAGTLLLIASFIYSLRKRKIIKTGSPKSFLLVHEYMAWSAALLLLIHAGVHFNAILPWLAVVMMLVAVASGLVGKFLFKKAIDEVKSRKQELIKSGLTAEEADKELFFDGLIVDGMKRWRVVHLPITLVFAALAALHILSIIMFST
jgi:hypothetical protein